MSEQRAVATMAPTHLASVEERGGMSRDQIDLLKSTFAKGATDDELKLAIAICNRTRLAPEARQIFFVKRWDGQQKKDVMQAQISIDGMRLLAERTGKYGGQLGPEWCGLDGIWQPVWLDDREPPVAARVGVIRTDWAQPLWAVARFRSYAQTTREGGLTSMWARMGDLMIAKCAESLALRRAFPAELSGLYTEDEMEQADAPPAPHRHSPPRESPPTPADATPTNPDAITRPQQQKIKALMRSLDLSGEQAAALARGWVGVGSTTEMSRSQASTVIDRLENMEADRLAAAEEQQEPLDAEVIEVDAAGDPDRWTR